MGNAVTQPIPYLEPIGFQQNIWNPIGSIFKTLEISIFKKIENEHVYQTAISELWNLASIENSIKKNIYFNF